MHRSDGQTERMDLLRKTSMISRGQVVLKRAVDITGASLGLLVLSPLLLFLYIAIRRDMSEPVFFRQVRPGRNGTPFEMIKFRSMREAINTDGIPLPDSERITPLGARLRASSMDELPELWNVLKGEMSLVGPRPLLMEYLPLYTPEQARRHEMCPGITGWAQINGRNALSWREKFALDIWYVDNANVLLDARIILMTVVKIVRREGISATGEATMPRFTGTEE